MAFADLITITGPTPETSFRLRLLTDTNPAVVSTLISLLPLRSFLLHVVVAGETFYAPVPTLSPPGGRSSSNMVRRREGVVYYNAVGQSICFCYGVVTESTPVNQFAEVVAEDLPGLVALGRLVLQQTLDRRVPRIVEVEVRRPGDEDGGWHRSLVTTTPPPPPPGAAASHMTGAGAEEEFDGSWESAKKAIDRETALLRRLVEPDDIQKIRLGAVHARAGDQESPFPVTVFLQGFLSMLGPHVITRLLTVSTYPEMTLPLMVRQTREFLTQTFNHFEFLGDLGLATMVGIGKMYEAALDSLSTLDDYRQLTDSLRTFVQMQNRWVLLIFPWYLKDQFQIRTPEEAATMPKLAKYE